jgi:hypothetical protein
MSFIEAAQFTSVPGSLPSHLPSCKLFLFYNQFCMAIEGSVTTLQQTIMMATLSAIGYAFSVTIVYGFRAYSVGQKVRQTGCCIAI